MPVTSAALLAYRLSDGCVEVFLGHMGGPFWVRKDDGAWSIPKGVAEPGETDLLAVARREFAEEIGAAAPVGDVLELGTYVQRGGKRVAAFAVRADGPLAFVASNTFELAWPPGSGRLRTFPEIDRAQWFDLAAARPKVVAGQVPILDALAAALG